MIYLDNLINYCLAKEAAEESYPFDATTLVVKVLGKMFCLIPTDTDELKINLKCDPEYAIELREQYESVRPGYHMNKKHWNTVTIDGELKDALVYDLIDHSYDLVLKSLPKKIRAQITQRDD